MDYYSVYMQNAPIMGYGQEYCPCAVSYPAYEAENACYNVGYEIKEDTTIETVTQKGVVSSEVHVPYKVNSIYSLRI